MNDKFIMILNLDDVFSSEDLLNLTEKTLESEALVKDETTDTAKDA